MSGTGGSQDCPECGGKQSLMTYTDWKPYDCCCGQCLECGFTYYTAEDQMKLKEVNELRADYELKPLKKLAERTN